MDERGVRYHGAGLPGQGQGGPAQDRERTAWIFDFAVLHDRKDGARHEGAALGGDGQSAYDRRQSGHLERAADLSVRSEEHTSELQSLMRISYAVFCLKKQTKQRTKNYNVNS